MTGEEEMAEHGTILKLTEENDKMGEDKPACFAEKNEYSQIHVLPAEILSLVFQKACLSEERMEINLSRVCRLWRSITLLSPNLWSTFIYCDGLLEVQRLSIYLERSGNYPVDLRLDIPCGDRTTVVQALLDKAIEHVARWRRFLLVVHKDSWPSGDLFAPLVEVSAPRLQHFEVFTSAKNFYEPDYDPLDPFPRLFRGSAPLLSSVRVDSNSLNCCMPYANITTLEIQKPGLAGRTILFPFSDALYLFQLPLLNLSLMGDIFDAPEMEPQQKITTTLKTFRCSDSIGLYICKYLHAPQLELLILRNEFFRRYASPFVDSNIATFPSLHTLSLIDCTASNVDDLSHFAQATESISRLYIWHSSFFLSQVHDPLYHMAKGSPQTILWPRLNVLTYILNLARDEDIIDTLDFDSYPEVFESRSSILKKHCTLELCPGDAQRWKAYRPTSWKRLEEGGFYREMQARGEDGGEYLPFPPTPFEELHSGSEDPFMKAHDEVY